MTRAPFPDDDFLLDSDVARDLYHRVACDLPIIDYHNHLPPEQMPADHRFRSVTEMWLEGDHYKWRAMRAAGVPERYCTGEASDWEKFEAWAGTVPDTLLNPLFHWTAMELRRPFLVDQPLTRASAREIYERCNAGLAEPGFSALGLLEGFRVAVACTTDDPTDSLDAHRALAARPNPVTCVYPTWRPDRAVAVNDASAWNRWIDQLEQATGRSVGTWWQLIEALELRHTAFHDLGCRASDHGLECLDPGPVDDDVSATVFDRLRRGQAPDAEGARTFRMTLLHHLAVLDHRRGWVQQFHLGALRGVNTRLRRLVGTDAGGDSIGHFAQAPGLAGFLDRLDDAGQLAKTVLYNLNPTDNELFATMAGNFQDGSVPGKIQWGAAWWFLDQLDGMEAQLRTLGAMGLLSQFVGMTTDSRSFLSYSRHDYFRRLFCQMLGADVRRGRLPDDRESLAELVRRVAFLNARDYFGFTLGRAAGSWTTFRQQPTATRRDR